VEEIVSDSVSPRTIDRAWADLERLALEIGPRVAGTPGERRAAELIVAAFAERGLEANRWPFRWVGWEPVAPPRVAIRHGDSAWQSLRAAPMAFTDSTPPGGVAGELVGQVT
jgi:hypothetical protein